MKCIFFYQLLINEAINLTSPEMIKLLSGILKTDFLKNTTEIARGTILSQIILLLVSPLLTRIYAPAEYAIYAIFVSVSSVLYVSSTGRYELALMLPKSHRDALNLLFLSMLLPIIFSIVVVAVFIILNILDLFIWHYWVYFLPISIILYAWNVALLRWASRLKYFSNIGRAKVYYAVVISISQVSLGTLLNNGYISLITGQLLGHIASIILYYHLIFRDEVNIFSNINFKRLIILFKKYSKFPIYLGPSGVLSFASSELPTILIFYIFSADQAAFYALSRRALSMPMSLIGNSIGEVFFQRISQHTNITTNTNRILLLKTWMFLFAIAILPMLIIYLYAENIFSYVFGTNWQQAGKYAIILSPFLLVQFCIWPTRMLLQVKSNQAISFVWFFVYLIAIILVFGLTAHYEDEIFTMICYSSISVAAYLVYGYLMYHYSSGKYSG